MDKSQKEKVVDDIGQIFDTSGIVVVARYTGLTVSEMQDLRLSAREVVAGVRVTKNRLAKLAIENKNCADISGLLTGMTLLVFSQDPVAAAKVAEAYAKKNNKFEILGGMMGVNMLDRAGVKAVSALPSRDELLSSIAGCIIAPAANLSACVTAPGANIASVLSTIEDKAAA